MQTQLRINEYTINIKRRRDLDTNSHIYWQYLLTSHKLQKTLFGRDGFTIGLSRYVYHHKKSAVLNAFFAATVMPSDTDEDYFNSYTSAEKRWARTFDCEQLQYEIMVLEEKYNA